MGYVIYIQYMRMILCETLDKSSEWREKGIVENVPGDAGSWLLIRQDAERNKEMEQSLKVGGRRIGEDVKSEGKTTCCSISKRSPPAEKHDHWTRFSD